MNAHTGIGASILRKEDRRFITGKGNYVADIKRPNMTAGVFLRSPHAHAIIKSIDTRAAAALPGVVAIFTGANLAADKVGGLPCAWGVSNADGSWFIPDDRRASAHVSDAPLGCFLGWRFWLCRKLKHRCLLTLA